MMNIRLTLVVLTAALQCGPALSQPAALSDPTAGFREAFGLGGHACKQYDDTGKLFIYSEGLPSISVISWLQRSNGGTRANVPMPTELIAALPHMPGCLPGKHHA